MPIENSVKEELTEEKKVKKSSVGDIQDIKNQNIKTPQLKRNDQKKNVKQIKNNNLNKAKQIDESITIENNKKTIKKVVALKNKKIQSENIATEKVQKEEVKNKKITQLREVKTSSPIEVVKVDEGSNSTKPKKKGWWST